MINQDGRWRKMSTDADAEWWCQGSPADVATERMQGTALNSGGLAGNLSLCRASSFRDFRSGWSQLKWKEKVEQVKVGRIETRRTME